MEGAKILIVEDDPAILEGLADLLEAEGYRTVTATDGASCLEAYRSEHPHLVLLDIMMPKRSGYDVCREIRRADAATPILMLTAKGQEIDKVLGLELGADDYIVKPFGTRELLARIAAALRRALAGSDGGGRVGWDYGDGAADEGDTFEFGDVLVDPRTMSGRRGDESFPLSRREIRLLRFFGARPGAVCDRELLLSEIWGQYYDGTTRTLDQHIAKLRRKIEIDPSHPTRIVTVHGVGYRFTG